MTTWRNPAFEPPVCKVGDVRLRPDGRIVILEAGGPDAEWIWVSVDDWAAVAAWHSERQA